MSARNYDACSRITVYGNSGHFGKATVTMAAIYRCSWLKLGHDIVAEWGGAVSVTHLVPHVPPLIRVQLNPKISISEDEPPFE